MQQIGFKNFRRFEDFPSISFSPITLLVGENNAGKSTVVKAILSVMAFLRSGVDPRTGSLLNIPFSFNNSYFTHIGTFARALCNKAAEGDDRISFAVRLGHYTLYIVIAGDREDISAVTGRVEFLRIINLFYNYELEYDFKKDNIHAIFHPQPYFPDLFEKLSTISKKHCNLYQAYFKGLNEDITFDMPIDDTWFRPEGCVLDALFRTFQARLDATIGIHREPNAQMIDLALNKGIALPSSAQPIQGISPKSLEFLKKKKKYLKTQSSTYRSIIGNPALESEIDEDIEYIYAHAVTQTVVYSAKDINDYFVKTVHEFANERIPEGSSIHSFILKWMKEFKIGVNYEMDSLGGEAHVVKITNFDGNVVNLADKGMGSIQLMILLFRLATKMNQRDDRPINALLKPVTIIIEEPEQNLHPMLQSKLAELFFSMNQDYGFRFIIETHSEYLIRRTQALVGSSYRDKKDFENPFKVYYFPANGTPYDMPYAKTGRFEEQFGSGFFDEATKWNREVLRNENAK